MNRVTVEYFVVWNTLVRRGVFFLMSIIWFRSTLCALQTLLRQWSVLSYCTFSISWPIYWLICTTGDDYLYRNAFSLDKEVTSSTIKKYTHIVKLVNDKKHKKSSLMKSDKHRILTQIIFSLWIRKELNYQFEQKFKKKKKFAFYFLYPLFLWTHFFFFFVLRLWEKWI